MQYKKEDFSRFFLTIIMILIKHRTLSPLPNVDVTTVNEKCLSLKQIMTYCISYCKSEIVFFSPCLLFTLISNRPAIQFQFNQRIIRRKMNIVIKKKKKKF